MSPRQIRLAIAAVLLAAFGGNARADIVNISAGTGDPGSFTGTIQVNPGTNTSATIIVTLKNTSPLANGGFITGFAFNDPGSTAKGDIGKVTSFTQSYAPQGAPPANYMSLMGTTTNGTVSGNSIAGSPFGSFDIGAAVGGDLLGAGAPQPGIEVNQTGTFTFTVTGTNLQNLTAAGLLSTGSTGGAALIVRFRGFTDGSSDKLVISPSNSPQPPPGVVPAPPAVVLAGVGLACCLLTRLRRRGVTAIA